MSLSKTELGLLKEAVDSHLMYTEDYATSRISDPKKIEAASRVVDSLKILKNKMERGVPLDSCIRVGRFDISLRNPKEVSITVVEGEQNGESMTCTVKEFEKAVGRFFNEKF